MVLPTDGEDDVTGSDVPEGLVSSTSALGVNKRLSLNYTFIIVIGT